MDAVRIGGESRRVRMMLSATEISSRVQGMAQEIEAKLSDLDDLLVLVVLDGALVFAADLIRAMRRNVQVETVKLKSYVGTQSSGSVAVAQPVPHVVTGRHVLIVEDIVDSGQSMEKLTSLLREMGVASVHVAALLDKPKAHPGRSYADFVGFTIGPNFVIGYGLDADGLYRNFSDILEVLP